MTRPWAPVAMAAAAAVVWGIWWIPIRHLETLGLHGAWAGIAMNAGAGLLALLVLGLTRGGLRLDARALMGAALVGVAVSTYSTALNYTDVVRAVLLFYLAPVWSKLIEWAFLGLPWRWTTTLALIAALSGAYLVLGGDAGAGALNYGDVLAVISGVSWAAGAALIFTGARAGAVSLGLVTLLVAVLLALPFGLLAGLPDLGGGVRTMAYSVGFGGLYVLPIMVMTLWAAQRLTPATITFLLTAEILSGVISGAIWAGEPFGPMQAAGAVLIVLAAVSEVFAGMRAPLTNRR